MSSASGYNTGASVQEASLPPYRIVANEVDLPLLTAVWVLFAHFVTTLIPLYMMWVVYQHWDYLLLNTYSPYWFYVAVAMFLCSSPFEVAQNTVDKWYLTKECGSALGVGFCDFLFWFFMILGMMALTVAAAGENIWLVVISCSAIVVYPFVYLVWGIPYPALVLCGIPATLAMYMTFGDPLIFFLIIGPSAVLMYFITAVLTTGAQFLHGFTTLSAGVGFLVSTWGMQSGIEGQAHSWTLFIIINSVLLIAGVALRPILLGLAATPHRLKA
ncbi:MAG: hypothetical protein GY727_13665 [Gammaproteobacteria bacterium]|nr:hypothetical protein [Gammaproteobacteria bacterium]MCP4088334.1 hypothetical protein [Gammaproteobacteria bacterium]MCP4276355.1 hypothetical protein [Gammaproteobacteria bacterium]MCP4831002.1 hypothetical protein [Gammaproteobacteria bacterium]MCP4927477.1 hypothetical protein [Gammaproteobacteria bacterium]